MLFLLRLKLWKNWLSSLRSPSPKKNGPTRRAMSPPSAGFSILMISAPRSAICIEPYGPAPYCSTAMTLRPDRTGSTSVQLFEPHDVRDIRFMPERIPLARYALDHIVRSLIRPRPAIANTDRLNTACQQLAYKAQGQRLNLFRRSCTEILTRRPG